MKSLLTIDCGNSSTKLAAWCGNELVEATALASDSASGIESFIRRNNVSQAIVGSVVGNLRSVNQAISNCSLPLMKLTGTTPVPLSIDYATPRSLGADRIAAAVGAAEIAPGRELLVVDIGTAITYDRVTADRHFLGGNISAGIGMRLRALNHFTSALPEVNSRGDTPVWGNSTETALRSGAVNGVVGELTYYRSLMPVGAVIVLTGGWSADIASRLDFETIVDPTIVSRGLCSILKFNNHDITQ